MKRILVDSSVWIDAFHSQQTRQVEILKRALENSRVCLCPPVLQEVLQGFKKENDYKSFLLSLSELEKLDVNAFEGALGAASIYRNLRMKGVTIRKSVDCLIAWYAMEFDLEFLQADKDFEQIAKFYPLKLL
jgi:predicted nucleic acid-binding protein